MSMVELEAALAVGGRAARRAHDDGVRALGLGEMGIGNTTCASALLAALTGRSAAETVGRGTGVDDAMLRRKYLVVERAVARHCAATGKEPDARELLRCLGGLELAAIVGAALEAARLGIAVVADGFISTVAILSALRMSRMAAATQWAEFGNALFFAHKSTERGHAIALEACAALPGCDARPLLDLEMRLGEGSGAALAMPILRAAAAVMREMATFASAGVSTGEHADVHAELRTDA
jgi:nicotinate-nucleotide--dimethylbenzimidazole phosphoribosyltransferase